MALTSNSLVAAVDAHFNIAIHQSGNVQKIWMTLELLQFILSGVILTEKTFNFFMTEFPII